MSYEFPTYLWPIEEGDRSAESHLNRLKEHTFAIDFAWWMLNRIWSEDSTGRISYAPANDDSLKLVATDTPSLKVKVKLGAGFLLGIPFRKSGDTTIGVDLVAPAVLPRIDTFGVNPTTGDVVIYEGTEHASPTAPAVASGIFKAGEVYLRVGSTAIYNSAASTGGYIQNLAAIFSLPGDEPHTSGLTVSGGAFIHDGSSGDITLPADGLSIEFNYAGEVSIDATDAAGNLVFRTGGATDRLTLGIPAEPIILHGSSHDLHLSANGKTLLSSGPDNFSIEASDEGIALVTDATQRYIVDNDGDHTFIGSLGNVQVRASGNRIDFTREGDNEIRATGGLGSLGFYVLGEALPAAFIGAAVQFLGDDFSYDFFRTSPKLDISGTEQFIINGKGDGIAIQTESTDRYEISAAGRHDIYGDAYFHDDVYILGSLFIGGVPVTPGGSPGLSGFGVVTLPGTVFEPAASGGSGGPDSAEFGSNVLLFHVFLKDVNTYCCAPNILMPLLYNPGAPVSVRVRWSANDTTTNTVRFSLQTAPQGEGDAASATLNTATTIVDANASTANQMRVTDWTEIDMTNIVAGDAFLLRLDRTGTHGSDILDDSIRVHSVDIRYFGGEIE